MDYVKTLLQKYVWLRYVLLCGVTLLPTIHNIVRQEIAGVYSTPVVTTVLFACVIVSGLCTIALSEIMDDTSFLLLQVVFCCGIGAMLSIHPRSGEINWTLLLGSYCICVIFLVAWAIRVQKNTS